MAVCTQWRSGGCGRLGLDYVAVRMCARWLGLEWSLGLWRKIQVLERFELGRSSERGGGDAASNGDR